ncbi:MAG: DUF4105 domain-containing protein [Verrucomicrobia bacterium]|nr:DUF4105 domain-containing protein [Verrucomicrobiota bacterium]
MAEPNRRSLLQLVGLCVSCGLLLVVLLGLTLWAAGALYFTLPFKEARGLSAAIYLIAVLGLLLTIRPLWKGAIAGVGLFLLDWGVDWMAHPIVSFRFGDSDHVAFSIELRRQVGQAYSPLAGLYKTYGLIYLVGDERDLVRVRTNYRKEDVYLYRTVVKPARARAIFLDYLRSLNALHEHPEFYNELTSNCTTNVRVHTAATAIGKPPPWDWRILINGYADQMLYERGDLVGQLPFSDLRKQALINEKARAADHDLAFSYRIRDGVIGF